MIHLYFFSIWKHLPSWKTTKCIELGKQVQKVNFCDNIVGYNTQTSTESYLKIQNILKPLGPTKWVSWDETGYGAPETQHAPVVHQMSHSTFNGVLNVFLYGDDGYIHHIWQTTCDKVPNPWGWCTWSLWYKIGDKIPMTDPSYNPLSIGANIHLGIEVSMEFLLPCGSEKYCNPKTL